MPQGHPRGRGMKRSTSGSVGQRSRSQEAEIRFGGLEQTTSFLTTSGQVGFLVGLVSVNFDNYFFAFSSVNFLIATLKPQSNGPLYIKLVIGTLAVVGTARRGLVGAAPPVPLLAVPNVTAHPSKAGVPTSYYLMWHL